VTAPTSGPDNPIGVDPARLIAAHRDARGFYRHQLLNADGPRRYLIGGLALEVRGDWVVGFANHRIAGLPKENRTGVARRWNIRTGESSTVVNRTAAPGTAS
jgi:hypothetical protein